LWGLSLWCASHVAKNKLQFYYGLGYCKSICKFTYNLILALGFKCEKWEYGRLITIWVTKVCDHRAPFRIKLCKFEGLLWPYVRNILVHTHTKEGGNQLHKFQLACLYICLQDTTQHNYQHTHSCVCKCTLKAKTPNKTPPTHTYIYIYIYIYIYACIYFIYVYVCIYANVYTIWCFVTFLVLEVWWHK
jgi:hypothetical protein